MFRFITAILICVSFTAGGGRTYTGREVRQAADSALRHVVSDRMYRHASCVITPYYKAMINGVETWELLEENRRTVGDFRMAVVRYRIDMPWPECPVYSHITGFTEVELDSLLRPASMPSLDSFPAFVLEQQPCALITKQEALAIAERNNFYLPDMLATLSYSAATRRFTWFIREFTMREQPVSIEPDGNNRHPVKLAWMRIDAATGEVLFNTLTDPGYKE